jgi:hypothetical protein
LPAQSSARPQKPLAANAIELGLPETIAARLESVKGRGKRRLCVLESAPHVVEPDLLEVREAERRIRDAAVFVLPPFWSETARHLIGVVRRAGTPVVCVMADIGYGVQKLDATSPATLPDLVCVADAHAHA